MIDTILFYAFALIALSGAVLTISSRNAVHSAVWLIFSLLGVSGLFLLQRAEFLFAVQIVLYVGGIMVLFLFVIMLVNLDMAARARQFSRHWPVAIAAVLVVVAEIFYILRSGSAAFALPAAAGPRGEGNTEAVGTVLLTEYLLPFEIASVLLLAAIVGSVVMAKVEKRGSARP